MTPQKKLIEVALPLEAINVASAREKSIRHGHPSTLHLWWARRPLAAARAVIFAQMVDDPSAHPDLFKTEKAQEKERQGRTHDAVQVAGDLDDRPMVHGDGDEQQQHADFALEQVVELEARERGGVDEVLVGMERLAPDSRRELPAGEDEAEALLEGDEIVASFGAGPPLRRQEGQDADVHGDSWGVGAPKF